MTEIKHGRSGNLFVHRPDKCDDVGCDICPDRPEKNLIGGNYV